MFVNKHTINFHFLLYFFHSSAVFLYDILSVACKFINEKSNNFLIYPCNNVWTLHFFFFFFLFEFSIQKSWIFLFSSSSSSIFLFNIFSSFFLSNFLYTRIHTITSFLNNHHQVMAQRKQGNSNENEKNNILKMKGERLRGVENCKNEMK